MTTFATEIWEDEKKLELKVEKKEKKKMLNEFVCPLIPIAAIEKYWTVLRIASQQTMQWTTIVNSIRSDTHSQRNKYRGQHVSSDFRKPHFNFWN